MQTADDREVLDRLESDLLAVESALAELDRLSGEDSDGIDGTPGEGGIVSRRSAIMSVVADGRFSADQIDSGDAGDVAGPADVTGPGPSSGPELAHAFVSEPEAQSDAEAEVADSEEDVVDLTDPVDPTDSAPGFPQI